jgi:small subunit ribosomal protein S9
MAEKKEAKTFYLGTGRRKTAVARVRVAEGKGRIEINGRPLDNYFTEDKDRGAVLSPLVVTEQVNRVDVLVRVTGGGITGQAGAISQGLARAIKTMFSPPDERKSFTFGNTTAVRARNVEKKPAPLATAAPSPDGTPAAAPPEDSAGGMVKKLRDSGLLTRDSRMKERKKYGLRGARRGTQFSKR